MNNPALNSARACLVESIPKGLEDLRGTPAVQYTEDVLVRLTCAAGVLHRSDRNVLGTSAQSHQRR